MFNNYPIGKRPARNGGVFFLFMVYGTRMKRILRSADGSGFWYTKLHKGWHRVYFVSSLRSGHGGFLKWMMLSEGHRGVALDLARGCY